MSALVFIISSRLAAQPGRAMNCLTDAVVGTAPASVGHLGIDVGVRRLRLFRQQRHSGEYLPRLAVAALGNVELFPGELNRMRPVGRQSLDGGDSSAGSS